MNFNSSEAVNIVRFLEIKRRAILLILVFFHLQDGYLFGSSLKYDLNE